MSKFGLIGKNIGYSFSKNYFTQKFSDENLQHSYHNFDIESIEHFKEIIKNNPTVKGLNVTIPYKEIVIPYLTHLSEIASKIGAVNTIKITEQGELKGYNTDYFGFTEALKPILKAHHKRALILGTGGASKAVAYALQTLNIPYSFVSRNHAEHNNFTYNELTQPIIEQHTIIVNCTPLGTHPNTDVCPAIPYQYIGKYHLLYDLIYNPSETLFLSKGKQQGAQILNGLPMLQYQAEKAWEIWNS